MPAQCPVVESSDWFAGIDAMPGPSGPRLVVTGKVIAPTGGYRFELGNLRVLESYPVQIVVHLLQVPASTPPPVALPQIAETHELRGEWPMQPPVGSVTVRCGDRDLARIAPVGTAH